MVATGTCVSCGTVGSTAVMDLTGHGWRCQACSLRSEVEAAHGRSAGMAEHLTLGEMELVARQGRKEALLGGLLAAGGAGTSALTFASGQIFVLFTGLMATGLGMIVHGLYRRSQAQKAIRQLPAARALDR